MAKGVTDMKSIRDNAVAFLYVDICETRVPFVASHPFTSTWHFFEGAGINSIMDLHDEDARDKWRKIMRGKIEKCDLLHLFMMMNPPYILNFLKFSAQYMSDADLGYILGEFWMQIEQISLDDSVTGREIISWFSRADKEKLMNEEEREIIANLPDKVTVYRGVTSHNKSRKKAFSWSTDRKVAEWFADRFQTGTGEVWTLTVPKERILCSFEGRNEHEVIVNLYGYDKKPTVEKLSHRAKGE